MAKYNIPVQLIGNDGNAFAIMGAVQNAMKRNKVPAAEIKQYIEEATSGDYDNLLRVTAEWVNVY